MANWQDLATEMDDSWSDQYDAMQVRAVKAETTLRHARAEVLALEMEAAQLLDQFYQETLFEDKRRLFQRAKALKDAAYRMRRVLSMGEQQDGTA